MHQPIMDTPQDETPITSPTSTTTSTTLSIAPSSYLSVPGSSRLSRKSSLRSETNLIEENLDLLFAPLVPESSSTVPRIHEPSQSPKRQHLQSPGVAEESKTSQTSMSVYSTSSIDSDSSNFSNPPAKKYRVPTFQNMSSSRSTISAVEKEQMIQALNSHHVNTLGELRRVEKAFAKLGSSDVAAPMTAAWSYYVNSHGLLTELRGLTKNYPFSSECLEEAKRRVYSDPESNRSWNFCWLVLNKIHKDQLVAHYAQQQASQPAMWGGQTPSAAGVTQLTNAFVAEWGWALQQMMRHWDKPPSR